MLEAVKTTILVVSALFPVVNPLGGSPVFLALTREYTTPARRQLAQRIAMNSFILLVASFLTGTHVLVKQKEEDDRGKGHREMDPQDIFRHAFYPLTLPLTVGPGSISVAITLGANAPRIFGANLLAILGAVIASALIAVIIFLCYGFADRLAMLIGTTGMSVVMRLSSFLLVCIGVQILWNGASVLLGSLLK